MPENWRKDYIVSIVTTPLVVHRFEETEKNYAGQPESEQPGFRWYLKPGLLDYRSEMPLLDHDDQG
jgi:hypothetical protein